MADTIKIGNLDISSFKVGSSDCKVYLGDTLLYPQSQPQVKDYFRFIAREDGTFKLSGNSLSYSLDSGTTWTSLASDTDSPLLSSGETIMFKATNPTVDNGIGKFISDGDFDVEGNIMSLIYGDDFETATTITNVGQFRSLFDSNTNVINASGLTLPATTISQDAYRSMFYKCSNLVTAPELPATTLGDSCYKYMFRECSITTAPELPSANSAQSCYANMFQGCTSLTTAPILSATTLQLQCYEYMFNGCTSLTTAPELPATTLASSCYSGMFQGCKSLTTAPELSATVLADRCYQGMFQGCTSLTTAPILSATTLASYCYSNMFQGCTSLTSAPELPATTLTFRCYYYMFHGCTSLNYIKCLATDISALDCTVGWVYNVAASGTFIKAEGMKGMRSWTTGDSGIPSGWLVLPSDNFAITSLADNNTITLTNNRQSSINSSFSYSLDKGATWTYFTLSSGQTKTIATINSGDTIHLKGSNNTLASNYNYGHYFRGTGDYEISGEISSLIKGNDYDTDLGAASRYTFAMLFSGDTHLVSAENLFVDSEILPQDCFNGTFRDCTRLTSAPELPSIRLGDSCYSSMFEGCIALSKVPSEIRFTYVGGSQVFQRMFCMSRTSKLTTPAMTESPKLFGNWGSTPTNQQMFCGNGNLNKIYCYWTRNSGSFSLTNWVNYTADSGVTFYKRSTATFASGVNGIKTGWTVVNDDSTQPT